MKPSKWAALLLSLLVLPGSGHLLLKRPVRGIVIGVIFGILAVGTTMLAGAILGPQLSAIADAAMSGVGEELPSLDLAPLLWLLLPGALTMVLYVWAAWDCWHLASQASPESPSGGPPLDDTAGVVTPPGPGL